MSHLPLRGMVRQKVLDLFAQMYRAGAQDLDLHADQAPEPGLKGQVNALVNRLARWYVEREQHKGAGR